MSVEQSAQSIADALAPAPSIPSARWRWGTVKSVNDSGTMNVEVGGATMPSIRCAQHVMGANVGDRVRVMFLGTEAIVDAVRAASSEVSMNDAAREAWLAALGMDTETIYEDATVSVKRFGRMVMVHAHGVTNTPASGVSIANVDLSAYKPSYNASALVSSAGTDGHIARMWVNATDGRVYLNVVNYSASDAWYGVLVYIY